MPEPFPLTKNLRADETKPTHNKLAVIGGGPAGLMAAEVAALAGIRVDVYDSMASVGRKFLLAGKGGLNLTHAETMETFLARYGTRREQLEPMLAEFGPKELRDWARTLGIETFVGSSGRVFPLDQKSAPLLRVWLRRLRDAGVKFHMRHRFAGFNPQGALLFDTPNGTRTIKADAIVLALGGGSWPKLGSDGTWVPLLAKLGIDISPLKPSNCGFNCEWSDHFQIRFAGSPVKPMAIAFTDADGEEHRRQGEFVITATGVEGGIIYALSSSLRDGIEAEGAAVIRLDLAPDRDLSRLTEDLSKPKGSASLAKHLKQRAGIEGVKAVLLRELASKEDFSDTTRLATIIKSLPLRLVSTRPLAEAISTAGGVAFEALDDLLMVKCRPGIFCAGEMLDWEAPTGGYLLTACFASGQTAGKGALAWLKSSERNSAAFLEDSPATTSETPTC